LTKVERDALQFIFDALDDNSLLTDELRELASDSEEDQLMLFMNEIKRSSDPPPPASGKSRIERRGQKTKFRRV
jgi:hypothetical protein